eukprot:3988938-Prymnesium_polylepis.2
MGANLSLWRRRRRAEFRRVLDEGDLLLLVCRLEPRPPLIKRDPAVAVEIDHLVERHGLCARGRRVNTDGMG